MKKRILALAVICLLLQFFAVGCGKEPSGSGKVTLDPISAVVETWSPPESYGRNTDFKVEVSPDGETWETLAVYNVKNGHQLGDALLPQGGMTYFGTPYVASLTVFDFTGTVGVRVTYQKGSLSKGGYAISPASYKIKSIQDENTVTFTLTQDAESPRKVVFRPAGEWEAQTLHIMTNVPEGTGAVNKTADNVYVVAAGEDVPRFLPAGKDTYYFEKGIHSLPGGWWADIDLGEAKAIKSFSIAVSSAMTGGLCFEIQTKNTADGAYQTAYKSVGADAENNKGSVTGNIDVSARYLRLILHGNFNLTPIDSLRFIMRAYIREFRVFDANGENLALGKAVGGSGKNFAVVTDGGEGADYGFSYAGETFAALDNTTYYLEKGAVLEGAFVADGREKITIKGRGILDGEVLEHQHDLSEGRNGSIHFERCKDVLVEGITIMNAPMWMVVINYSENVRVDGINLFGYCTNADGIHFSATKKAVATGCFIRSCDDLFVAYHYGDSNDLTFKNSVLWTDGARVLLLGLASSGDIKNVTMQNCDVITFQNAWDLTEAGGMVQVIATADRVIQNVLVKDIRVDAVRAPRIAIFAQIRTGSSMHGEGGNVDGVTFENISLDYLPVNKSMVMTMQGGGSINGVVFKDIVIDGTLLTAQNLKDFFNKGTNLSVTFQNS